MANCICLASSLFLVSPLNQGLKTMQQARSPRRVFVLGENLCGACLMLFEDLLMGIIIKVIFK